MLLTFIKGVSQGSRGFQVGIEALFMPFQQDPYPLRHASQVITANHVEERTDLVSVMFAK